MGVCCDNGANGKKISIKIKRKKKQKSKDKYDEINFEIVDVNNEDSKQILTKTNITLRELLAKADFNLTQDFDVELKSTKNINLNEEFNTNLKDILEKYYPDSVLLSSTIFVKNKGLSIPSNIKKAYEEMSPLIGNAILDRDELFGLSIYNRDEKNLKTYFFEKSIIDDLKKFNVYSSFCSGRGVFYISGGENEKQNNIKDIVQLYGNFISINMNMLTKEKNYDKLDINTILNKLPSLNVERSWHSMIFIPNNYIFIVGGINTKSVERYDIGKNEIKEDSELKEKRCEPSLCLVNNNYLYAFCGFYPFKDFNDNIERCDLLKKKREWELITISSNIKASFFGISFFKDDQILLISSKDNMDDENKNYEVKIGKDEDTPDEIKETVIQFNGMRTFKDKFFYPINEDFCVNIPMNIGNNKNILILDINTGNIECKTYK